MTLLVLLAVLTIGLMNAGCWWMYVRGQHVDRTRLSAERYARHRAESEADQLKERAIALALEAGRLKTDLLTVTEEKHALQTRLDDLAAGPGA
ncbi:hypothetical protein Ppa06_57740 [Planomonospora parontospora subsp. parontospora]|uniref:Uncharacterized protein n=2 Tax=Planomonospora parontospora TaxID=58119 RepID=A0AA37BLV0_9ACTN|nr:hypothetical protein [Planomonospora parontospora]GGK90607.1 hypothetical protein GCM10010126_57570 [Planomonospora parontospora]GII11976.1 hypothetical protein Ppa06_57740 [Planomonospora parontospora subsp. parontospora]